VKFSGFTLGQETRPRRVNYGNPYRRFIDNVPSPTRISGPLTRRCYQASLHQAIVQETGKTSYIERFNNTLRQGVSRVVRKTLSFSKSLNNHIGAIWYFIHHYLFRTTLASPPPLQSASTLKAGALFDVYQFDCDTCDGLVICRESWIKWQGEVLPTVAVDR